MAVHISNMRNLKLYKGSNRLFVPLSNDSNKTGSVIYLLTSNIDSSINLIQSPMIMNRNWFKSYYFDKSVNAILSHTGKIEAVTNANDVLTEAKLATKKRNSLPDSDFGIPELRKYPLHDKNHVLQAIRMFHHCPPKYQKTLAKNIISRMNHYGITDVEVSKENPFHKYYHTIKEYQNIENPPYSLDVIMQYRFSEFTNKDTIQDEVKECNRLTQDPLKKSHYQIALRDAVYLCKCYNADNDLCAFAVSSKNTEDELYIYTKGSKIDYEKDKHDIFMRLMALYTDDYHQTQKSTTKSKYLKVYYVGDSGTTQLLKKINITLKQLKPSAIASSLGLVKNATGEKPKPNCIIIKAKEFASKPIKEDYQAIVSETKVTNDGFRIGDTAYFFNNDIFTEGKSDSILRKYLYNERIRTTKEIEEIYSYVKEHCPVIKYTKIDFAQYKGMNLYFDISYYHNIFLDKNDILGQRGIALYSDMLLHLLNNTTVDLKYPKKTIFIPIMDYFTGNDNFIDFKKSINPISLIIHLIRTNKLEELQKIFGHNDIIFFGMNTYFKANFGTFQKSEINKFITCIKNTTKDRQTLSIDDDFTKDTPDAIVIDIIDKIEKSQNIELYSALGKTGAKAAKSDNNTSDKESSSIKVPTNVKVSTINSKDQIKDDKEVDKDIADAKKKKLISAVTKAANTSTSTDEALDKLDNDKFVAELIQDISDEESTEVKVSTTRKSRMMTLNKEFESQNVKGKTVREMLNASKDIGDEEPLQTTSVHINSINNNQWDNLKFINFNQDYDVDDDIVMILDFFSSRSVPVGIRDINVEDASSPEDLKETWTVQMEDINGQRFQIKFDIPKFKNNRFMRINGNDKTINGQLMNLPLIKTDIGTAQMTTNYNKIFVEKYGTALGKSNVVTDKIIKAMDKYDGKVITSRIGNNKISGMKYEVPIDYADLGSAYSYIQSKDIKFFFDQDEIRKQYDKEIDLSKGLPIGYDSSSNKIIYCDGSELCSITIARILCEQDERFKELFDKAKPSVKYTYSRAKCLNTMIPIVVICCYCEGLITTLNKAQIKYEITDKRPKYNPLEQDLIRFNDGYLVYDITYQSSMLMNGLKDCNTEEYSIKDVNTKTMWIEMLDHFGGRIKADGLDNFYDLMFDPITIRVCNAYHLPEDFVSGLIYVSDLLSDTKFNKHIDITGNRLRTNEIVAAYAYNVLSKAYGEYKIKVKKTGKGTISLKQSAIIDAILEDSSLSDMSTTNDLGFAEASNTVSFKGLSGMNSARSYSLDKRTYDESMVNILGMSTGFAATVGINRVATTNANVNSKRGYITDNHDDKIRDMNDVNTMTICENLTPMCSTHDDPMREAMSYIQRTKHDIRIQGADPLLITNGMDDALSQFTPDRFSVNAKEDGEIIERDDEHIIIRYKSGKIEYVDLTNNVFKDASGGFYTAIQLKPAKLGTRVKKGQIIAYDPLSYTTNVGYDDNPTYNQGTLIKTVIITTDKGFEDSCSVTQYVSDAMSSNIVMQVPVTLDKNTNVYNMLNIGDHVEQGDPLMVIQNTYDDNDINSLLRNLVDNEDEITSLGRIPIQSHNTGYIEDIQIFRTCELDELSPSLRKIVSDYEKEKKRIADNIAKYDETKAKEYFREGKAEPVGKLKNVTDGVLIEFYITFKDDFGVGDKLIFLGAQKGVVKEVIPAGMEPYSSYREDEPIDAIVSMTSFNKRMCCAPIQYTLANKGLIELDRQVKDIMGIAHDNTVRHKY